MLQRLETICHDLLQQWEMDLEESSGKAGHVHLILVMHPNIMLSRLVNNLKTVACRLLRKKFAEPLNNYYRKPVWWTRAYC